MPRVSRKVSETGVYHVMTRGINRQNIFQDREDRIVFLDKLSKTKESSDCIIYAFCLMSNHVHLIIGEGKEPIGKTMKRLGSSYVYWYNQKYGRVGHLFQGRFHSEPVNVETYMLVALRYIHQNPVKAGIVQNCKDYPWTSYHEYINPSKQFITDTGLGIDIAGGLRQFIEFHNEHGGSDLIDVEDVNKASDEIAEKLINQILMGKTADDILNMKKAERNKLLREVKTLPGVSQRQIENVTGLSRNIIQRA